MIGNIVKLNGSIYLLVLSQGKVEKQEDFFLTLRVTKDPVSSPASVLSQARDDTEGVWWLSTTPIFVAKSVLDKLEATGKIDCKIVQSVLRDRKLIEKALIALFHYLAPRVGSTYGIEKYTLGFNLAAQGFLNTMFLGPVVV